MVLLSGSKWGEEKARFSFLYRDTANSCGYQLQADVKEIPVNCRAHHSDMEISNKLAQKIVPGEKPRESSHTFLL